MKRIFIDTNIIIDLLSDRKPYNKVAVELFEHAANNNIKLFTSSHSFAEARIRLTDYSDDKTLNSIFNDLLEFLTLIPTDVKIITQALKSKSKNNSFDDNLQILTALEVGKMDCIVTNNVKALRNSGIPVFAPDEVLRKLSK